MRRYLIAAAIFYCNALTVKAQAPQLTVDGKTNNGVRLHALKIDIQVCGTIARTTWQMTFKNTTSRVLEGTLNFPMKDGLSVSRYALDINGKMREAVPVDRNKGIEVFETIERRRVDPGLLEKTDGNSFRTRIYPINPNNTRTIIIGYEEELPATTNNALHYYLPLNLKDTVTDFDINVSVIQTVSQPVFDSSLNENLQFSSRNNQFTAAEHKSDYVPSYSLSFSIPKPADAAEVMLQEFENNYYYLINTSIQKNERQKKLPGSIGLLWDASLSGANRNISKELDLLDAYFKKVNNATIDLVVFSNTIKSTRSYTMLNGNWNELKTIIEKLQYDGATNLGNLNLKNTRADEFILVSDGHQTLGEKQIQLSNKPIYCINSSATADYSNLKFIAGKTGGEVIDLQKESQTSALKILNNETFRFLGIKQNAFVSENYPSIPVAAANNFAVAGIARDGVKEITLQFGYGNTITYEKTIAINTETQLCENFDITKVFAQKKIAELDIQYNQNKVEIERLGRRFGIVTRNTSLIVLETINDYIQHEIEPPAELRAEYDRIMKQRSGNIITKKKDELQNSRNMMATLKDWYEPKPPKKEPIAKKPKATRPVALQRRQPEVPAVRPSGNARPISGRITNDNGSIIAGATIRIRGANIAVATDHNGAFSINARSGDVLEISSVGYEMQRATIRTNTTIIDAQLKTASTSLSEVVVTALGIRRQAKEIGYATTTVKADELTQARVTNIATGLAGKVAGLQINLVNNGSAADTRVTLRGNRSILGDNAALLIVDDVQVPLSNLSTLNPADVDEVNVLKDAAATELYGSDAANGVIIVRTKNAKANSSPKDSSYKKIPEVHPFDTETFDYIAALKQTERAKRYSKYLELRQYYLNRPTYFFETASYFLKMGDKATGITILSNLAELENGNYELYKMLGYKLKEAGDYESELSAFKKVLDLRSSDPQSFRDYALAYVDLGDYQKALDLLYEGMTKSYSDEMNRMYSGIEEIFLTEINHLIAAHKNVLNLKNIDRSIIATMPTDIRVVMNWNKNNTDIDLWVTDPNGEKCYYGNRTTAAGGRISDDFTEGFGPEQFMLKKGAKGKYRIEIDYYNDTQVTIAGPTTIMAEIYLNYGTDKEEKRIITLQMAKEKEGAIFIGEVEL